MFVEVEGPYGTFFLISWLFSDLQVLNAQRAGYKAAIVHNVDSDDLISMGSNDSKYRYHFSSLLFDQSFETKIYQSLSSLIFCFRKQNFVPIRKIISTS